MRLSGAVVYIANRNVYRPIFNVTGTNRDCGLVAADDNWAEKCAMGLGIFANHILDKSM